MSKLPHFYDTVFRRRRAAQYSRNMPTIPKPAPRHNKYRVGTKENRTYDGVVYDSEKETRFAWEMECLRKAGEIAGWFRQIPLPLIVDETLVKTYHIDFVIAHNDGHNEYIEIKGFDMKTQKILWPGDSQLTWKLFLALYRDRLYGEGHQITLIAGEQRISYAEKSQEGKI